MNLSSTFLASAFNHGHILMIPTNLGLEQESMH